MVSNYDVRMPSERTHSSAFYLLNLVYIYLKEVFHTEHNTCSEVSTFLG